MSFILARVYLYVQENITKQSWENKLAKSFLFKSNLEFRVGSALQASLARIR